MRVAADGDRLFHCRLSRSIRPLALLLLAALAGWCCLRHRSTRITVPESFMAYWSLVEAKAPLSSLVSSLGLTQRARIRSPVFRPPPLPPAFSSHHGVTNWNGMCPRWYTAPFRL